MSRKMEGTVKEILGTCQVLQLYIFFMQFLFTGTGKCFDVETIFLCLECWLHSGRKAST